MYEDGFGKDVKNKSMKDERWLGIDERKEKETATAMFISVIRFKPVYI